MRVRVKKELPFAEVGEMFEKNDDGSINAVYGKEATKICKIWVQRMVCDGWLEEVKEDSLAEKIRAFVYPKSFFPSCEELADFAREHYREKVEEWIKNNTHFSEDLLDIFEE